MDQEPIRPDRSGYFTSRNQVPQSDMEGRSLIGRKEAGVLKTLWRELGSMVYALRHPVRYFKYGDDDPEAVQKDIRHGKFHARPELKSRKVAIDIDHKQKMSKIINQKIHKEYGLGYDDEDIDQKEAARVRMVRVGEEDGDPEVADKDSAYKEEVRKLRKEYAQEQEVRQARNQELGVRFADFRTNRADIDELAEEVERLRKELRKLHKRYEAIPFGSRREVVRTRGETKLMKRTELWDLRHRVAEQLVQKKAELQQKRDEFASRSDLERETPEVMERVTTEMNNFVESSQSEYQQLMVLLEKFPTLMERVGGGDSVAKVARGDQIRRFRKDDITKVEKDFVAAQGNEDQEKELATDLYAKRLMAQRLDEINRLSESTAELNDRLKLYQEGKGYLFEGDQYEDEKQRLGKPEPQFSSDRISGLSMTGFESVLPTDDLQGEWKEEEWGPFETISTNTTTSESPVPKTSEAKNETGVRSRRRSSKFGPNSS